jgi:hypothetical protein
MGATTPGDQDIGLLILFLALPVVAMIGAILHARHEWRALRHKLFRQDEESAKVSQPGQVAGRLGPGRWDAAIRETLDKARRDLSDEGGTAAGEAVSAAGEGLPELVDSLAKEAMQGGDLRSALVRSDKALVYVLAFAGRPEDRRKIRGYQAFAEGWPAHATAVRRAAGGEGAPPMVALLYFLGLDARDGKLLVAYEGDEGRRYPSELAEPTGGPAVAPGLSYEFALA